ncbi:MAG: dihydroorotase [Gammaproteobacteria bacterium]|nr:dihydroorotase [Gammaproteobacteria bacterium]
MPNRYVLKNGTIVNENQRIEGDIAIDEFGRIGQIGGTATGSTEIDVSGSWILPGMIDDQVHFREPGMEHKATIATESRAALAGGITSYMEMPNCIPQTINRSRLLDKHERASQRSLANFGFYLGATNENLEEIKAVDQEKACGVKVFMGASTGNMLVDEPLTLEGIFASCPLVIATHCEDTPTILANEEAVRERYGANAPPGTHASIRSAEACFKSSSLAVDLAKRMGSRLHVLHLTTSVEMGLFETGPIESKQITAEVCIHHLHFNSDSYESKGADIKCNPSIKSKEDQLALQTALNDDRIDAIATDHAPHTREEKNQPFLDAPAGLPLVEFALPCVLEFVKRGTYDLERIVEKVSHAPAKLFNVRERGFLREGYWADLVVVDPTQDTVVDERTVFSKCGWTPFAGSTFSTQVTNTFVNGNHMYSRGEFLTNTCGMALQYDR